jgi:16S rRNA G966 N2-methylase RsmD
MGGPLQISLNHVPLDELTVPQRVLDIQDKTRANLLPWKGQFSPQLVQALLEEYGCAGARVLDPFAGSGTVLAEASRRNVSATGVELNPAAHALASVYSLANLDCEERNAAITAVESALRRRRLSSASEVSILCRSLLSARAQLGLSSERVLIDGALVLADFGGPKFDADQFRASWQYLRALVRGLPHSVEPIRAIHADARSIPVNDSIVDLVITSPPYINVFNYHQQFRTAVELLGWDVLSVAQSEIGSNRKHRSNRFLTVIQYCLDLGHALEEFCRVSVDGARLIIVIGRESTVRGTTVRNGELLLNLAVSAVGLDVAARQERKFLNRYGQTIVEDILHLTAKKGASYSRDRAVAIAVACLESLLDSPRRADVRDDIEQAVLDANSVRPSRLYEVPSRSYATTHSIIAP